MSILGSLLGTNSNRPEPSETMQNNAGGLMNRFNPLNLASGMFGKRKPGAADNYAGSSDGMKKGLKNKKDPRFVTKSVTPETPVHKGESVTDIAAKLFALFKSSFDEENKEEKIKKNSEKSMEAVRNKRNKELIAALTAEPKDLKKETKDIKKQQDQVKKEIPKQPAAPKPSVTTAPKPGAPAGAAPKGPAPAQPPTAAAPKGPTPSATPAPKPGPSAAPAPSAGPTIPTGTAAKVVVGGTALAGTTAAMAMPSPAVADVIQKAAKTVGVDVALMYAMAKQESGFNPNAAAKTSSAKGLYQFIRGTWKSMVEKYGSKYPILKQRDALDPEANALAGALFIKENSDILDQAKIPVNATTVYAAHFLGPGGAKTLLKGDPNKPAASVLPSAASANKFIFYKPDEKTKKPDTNKPRTIQEVINVLFEKVGKYQELYSVALKDSNTGKRLAEASTEGRDLKKETASAGGTVIVNQNNNIVATADKARTMTVPRSDGSRFVQGATT